MINKQNQPSNNKGFRYKWRYLKGEFRQFQADFPKIAIAVKTLAGLVVAGILSILGFFLIIYFGAFGKIPTAVDLKDIRNHEASEIYSSDSVLLGKYYIENREIVGIDDISPDIINALIATEDARFFQHNGIDLRAWVRVFFKTILLGDDSAGGGSTLSQQLAKNIYKREKHRFFTTPVNKIKEMVIARRLEKVYTKEELINLYLNTVPFGFNMYGVEVASNQLFNTSAKEISTQNAAVIVGMLKGNTYYNPARNPKNATSRRNTVLSRMEKYSYLNTATVDSLQQLPLVVEYKKEGNNLGIATYFRENLRQDLNELIKAYKKPNGESYNIYTDGLKIYTTVDSRMQQYAEEAVAEQMKLLQKSFDTHWKGKKPWAKDEVIENIMKQSQRYQSLKAQGASDEEIKKVFDTPVRMTIYSSEGDETKDMSPLDSIKYYYALLNAGFLVMEPKTGAIMAWVGGLDHKYLQYDHVKSRRQVGSTFKPIVYAKALERGIEPCDYIANQLTTFIDYDDWTPQNADGKYGGYYSMKGGITGSVNVVAVNLIMRAEVGSVVDLAHKMGVTSRIPQGPAIALGAVDVSLFDMVKVYGTLANRGVRQDPYYITRIETSDGEVLAEFYKPLAERVLDIDNADIMIDMMQSVVDSGTAKRLRFQYGVQGQIAGKTGTTQSHADGWFMGFTPKLVAGAWVGGESPQVHFRSLSLGQGANTALPIWGRFMNKVYKDKSLSKYKNGAFPIPSEEVLARLDCPPFYEELPMLVSDSLEMQEEGLNAALDRLFESLRKDKRVNEKPDRTTNKEEDARTKESERIRKENAKLEKKREKKKKRKEFWDRLTRKKNKE
ncbi:MAG: penicillin-binding protein 1A [Saprospiraceae bacterium]|jgi:penicillin-binding protein 1A